MEKFITLNHLETTAKALINKIEQNTPTKTSDLINDSEFITQNDVFSGNYNDLTNKPTIPAVTDTYSSTSTSAMSGVAVNSAITSAIGNINSFEVAVVASLPTENIDNHTIYFVPSAVNASVHDEYMYINNNWEQIGSTSIDLSNYLQTSDIADWAKAATKPTYTASEVGALTKTYGDALYMPKGNESTMVTTGTQDTLRLGKSHSDEGFQGRLQLSNAAAPNSNGYTTITPTATKNISLSLPSADGTLALTSNIPTVPTNVSAFINDAGYLTSYTETDPIFTASAAGGISATDISNWNNKSDFSGSYNDLADTPTIPTVPTNVSAFTNDAGYLTLADLPIYDGTVQNG